MNYAGKHHIKRLSRWSRRTFVIITASIVALLLITGGSYALYFGPHDSATDTSSNAVNLNKGLVGYWQLNGNVKDNTPYSNNGTNEGATYTTGPDGQANGGMSFNGSGQYVQMPVSTSTALSGNAESVAVWVKATNTNYAVFSHDAHWTIRMFDKDWEIIDSQGTYHVLSLPGIDDGNWHHVAFTYDGTTIRAYVDGQLTASSASPTIYPTSAGYHWWLGQSCAGSSCTNDYTGALSGFRVYNRALSPTEITALYKEGSVSGVNSDAGESGLVGEWKLNGNTKDSTPNDDNGSLYNSPTYGADRNGAANSALVTNDLNAYMGVPDEPNLEYTGGNMSISLWVNPSTGETTGGYIFSKPWNGGGQYDYQLYYNSGTHKITFELEDGGSTPWSITSTAALTPDSWSNVVLTLSSSQAVNLYVNGVDQSATSTISNWTPSKGNSNLNLAIGTLYPYGQGWNGNAAFNFDGSISDVRVYNRVLDTSDVSNLYNSYNSQIELGGSGQSGSVSLGSGLVGYWPFNGNAKDATPFSDNGTLVNSPTLTANQEGQANSAYSFNGSNQYINLGTNATLTPPSISISVWVNASSLSSWNGIISNMTSWGTGFSLQMGTSQNIAAMVSGTYLKTSWTPSTGVWYNIVATHNASTNANVLYVNGAQQATSTQAVSYEANAKTYIGVFYTGPSLFFNGTIDNVRIYNRALSAAEVQALYQENN